MGTYSSRRLYWAHWSGTKVGHSAFPATTAGRGTEVHALGRKGWRAGVEGAQGMQPETGGMEGSA